MIDLLTKLIEHLKDRRTDPLKHFSRDGPGWRLTVYVVSRLTSATLLAGLIAATYRTGWL